MKEQQDLLDTKIQKEHAKATFTMDQKEVDKLIKDYTTTRNMWRERKLNCIEVVEMIADGVGKKTKVVMV